ncbi:MAG: hypothetical protein JXR84_13490 [Anaerolineae bacterium]|nr:hypothetical protein [Anaerolineae bacterium]
MTTMIRKQVYLEPRQDVAVKQLAAERKTTEAEVIREAIDTLLGEVARQRRAQQAWEEALALMEARYAQGPVSGGRTWTREELYTEQVEQYGKSSD